jgi:hypothetical protein
MNIQDKAATAKSKIELWNKAMQGNGDADSLMEIAFLRGMISQEDFEDYQRISEQEKKDSEANEEVHF